MLNENELEVKERLELMRTLAGRIYDLDRRVYDEIGSNLGRVFNGERDIIVDEIVDMLRDTKRSHILRSDLALIANMARSIRNKQIHKEVMTEYDTIVKTIEREKLHSEKVEVIDKYIAGLNTLVMKKRFLEGQHLIICISRSYGSAGDDIGFALSDHLEIDYYDAEIFKTVIKRLEAEKDQVDDITRMKLGTSDNQKKAAAKKEEKNPGMSGMESFSIKEKVSKLNRYHGLPIRDAIFFKQSEVLCDMAKKQDFVVMGRCADQILTNNCIPHISIFITAPKEQRIQRIMEMNHVDKKTAIRQMKEVDRAHAQYYSYYTGRRWGEARNYDLCVNSASYGVKGSVDFILSVLKGNGIEVKEK